MATRIAFVRQTALTNVAGRVDYISNPKRQEHMLASYQTTADPEFWKDLAATSQNRAGYHPGKQIVEARELILMFPNNLVTGDHEMLAKMVAEDFKRRNGVEVAVGVHLNKRQNNYHVHLVYSERKLQHREPSIATRNTYFDADGKRSTKAACLDADGRLLPGCSLVRKGEAFPADKFGPKDNRFYSRGFLQSEKERYAQMFTELSNDTWVVYNHTTNPHLAMIRLKRGEPDGVRTWKERENEARRRYNAGIDRLLAAGELTLEQALDYKGQVYADRAELRERREQTRAEWIRWHAQSQERREAYAEHSRQEYMRINYTESGRPRSTIELVAILGLMIAGVDLFADIDDELDERLRSLGGPPERQIVDIEGSRQVRELYEQGRHKTSLLEQIEQAAAQSGSNRSGPVSPDRGSR